VFQAPGAAPTSVPHSSVSNRMPFSLVATPWASRCMGCRAVAQPETLNLEPYILNFQREELEKSFHAVKSALAISQASRDDVAKRHEEQVKALEEDNERLRCRIASLEADVGEGQRAQLASEDAWEERSSRLTDRVSALTAELEATKSDRDAAIADAEEIAQVRAPFVDECIHE